MDIHLIAVDLDGTLLNSQHQVSERNKAVLARAAEKGITVVPSTGRAWAALPEEVKTMEFVRYFIMGCGSNSYDRKEDQELFRVDIFWKDAIAATRYLRGKEIYFDCYKYGLGYTEDRNWERLEKYADEFTQELVRKTRKFVPNLEELFEEGSSCQKINLFFQSQEQRDQICRELREQNLRIQVDTSMPRCAEVYSKDAGKGRALRALCEHLGMNPAHVLAIGDSSNDLTMLEFAGVSVAMANAEEAAKRTAKYQTLSNAEDGVADFLERYVL